MAKSIYTDAVSSSLVSAYQAEKTYDARYTVVQKFADELGVSVKSVIAHLVRKNCYVKKEVAKKERLTSTKKADLVSQIGELLVTESKPNDLVSLEKCNVAILELVLKSLQ